MIDDIATARAIDHRRVYVTGISNGASMAHRLALEIPERIAAIAPVINSIAAPLTPTAAPAPGRPPPVPVPVLMIMGDEDPLVPHRGGAVRFYRRTLGEVCSTADAIRIWVARNGAVPGAEVSYLEDRDPGDGTRVRRERHAGPAEVILLAAEGGGHTWPGGRPYFLEAVIGRTCRDFDACEAIWEFFATKSRAGAPPPPVLR